MSHKVPCAYVSERGSEREISERLAESVDVCLPYFPQTLLEISSSAILTLMLVNWGAYLRDPKAVVFAPMKMRRHALLNSMDLILLY